MSSRGSSPAPGRSPASAARHRTAGRPCVGAAPAGAGTAPARARPAGAVGPGAGEGAQVLEDAQVRKDLSAFGHQGDAGARHPVRRHPGDRPAGEGDLAGARPEQAHDRPHERRLAHAVAAQDADDLAGPDRQVDSEQDFAGAVARVQAADREQRRGGRARHGATPAASPR